MIIADRQARKPPPRCLADTGAEAAPCGKTEGGFTLQTLIVTAVFVLAAVGTGLGLLAVNSASSGDFEEAGKTGVEARCAPNEIWDPELESRGIGGPDSQGGIRSRQVGCETYCGTWEYLSTGANENGEYEPAESPTAARQSSIGGPEGNGGVFSQNIGCFAPCYWNYKTTTRGVDRVSLRPIWVETNPSSSLVYYDDNRAPITEQVRLGVNYRRTVDPAAGYPTPNTRKPTNHLWQHSDINPSDQSTNKDGKPIMQTRPRTNGGSSNAPGTPLAPEQIAAGVPTVFKPNWITRGTDPGGTARNTDRHWRDENWEVRADPYEKECTIVNITLDDQVVCSSKARNCPSS